jgi:hypothetical protein
MTLLTCIGSSSYDYVKQDTGERKQGASFTYLSRAASSGSSNRNGWVPIESRIELAQKNLFDKLPAVYDVEFALVPRRSGGVDQVFVNAKFVRPIDLDFPALIQKEQVKA